MIDIFICSRCKNTYDEFERNDRASKIDHQEICQSCRVVLEQTYPRGYKAADSKVKIKHLKGKMGKQRPCVLCKEIIPAGSHKVQYKGSGKSRRYMHEDCPEHRQGTLPI